MYIDVGGLTEFLCILFFSQSRSRTRSAAVFTYIERFLKDRLSYNAANDGMCRSRW